MKPFTFPVVLAADATIDLQMHTTFSDGTWMPEQLIDYLVSEQFGLGAITDHDRVDTAAALQHLAAEKQLPLLTKEPAASHCDFNPSGQAGFPGFSPCLSVDCRV
jgi:phenolic acid decarboxylase